MLAVTSIRRGKRVVVGFSGGDSKDDLLLIARLIEASRIRPVIDRTYRLQELPPPIAMWRLVESGAVWWFR